MSAYSALRQFALICEYHHENFLNLLKSPSLAPAPKLFNHFESPPTFLFPPSPISSCSRPRQLERSNCLALYQLSLSYCGIDLSTSLPLLHCDPTLFHSRHLHFFFPPSIKSRPVTSDKMTGFKKFLRKLLCGCDAASKEEPAAPSRLVVLYHDVDSGVLPYAPKRELPRCRSNQPRKTSSVYSRPTGFTPVPSSVSSRSVSPAGESEADLQGVRQRAKVVSVSYRGVSPSMRQVLNEIVGGPYQTAPLRSAF